MLKAIPGYLTIKQALQDRLDDQSVTLRLTKETNAELQVRCSAEIRGRGDPDADLGTCR